MGKALNAFLARLAAPLTGDEQDNKNEKPRLGKKRRNTEPENRKD